MAAVHRGPQSSGCEGDTHFDKFYAHWESDVNAGRTIGAATVARLHAEPAFLADLEATKAELKAVRDKGLPPQRDCEFEKQALSQTPFPP